MKFCWCTMSVSDMEESLKFYQQIVGLKLNKRYTAGPGVELAFLGEGETQVELVCRQGAGVQTGGGVSLGFEVDSLEEKMSFVKQRGLEIEGPFEPNPHISFFFVEDPNGVRIQFVENK